MTPYTALLAAAIFCVVTALINLGVAWRNYRTARRNAANAKLLGELARELDERGVR